jgi:hypothetical protein
MHIMDRTDPVSGSDVPSGTTSEGPIALVREGMRVIDSAGEEIGTVELVKMGDPEAVTAEGEDIADEGLFDTVGGIFGAGSEPDLPRTLRGRLLRYGFIKIDGKGLFSKDRYVKADRIAGVSGDTVRLNVPKDRAAEEA